MQVTDLLKSNGTNKNYINNELRANSVNDKD